MLRLCGGGQSFTTWRWSRCVEQGRAVVLTVWLRDNAVIGRKSSRRQGYGDAALHLVELLAAALAGPPHSGWRRRSCHCFCDGKGVPIRVAHLHLRHAPLHGLDLVRRRSGHQAPPHQAPSTTAPSSMPGSAPRWMQIILPPMRFVFKSD